MHRNLKAAPGTGNLRKVNAFLDFGGFILDTEQPGLPVGQRQQQAARVLIALNLGCGFQMKPKRGGMLHRHLAFQGNQFVKPAQALTIRAQGQFTAMQNIIATIPVMRGIEGDAGVVSAIFHLDLARAIHQP